MKANRRKHSRLYQRGDRWWADFRDYHDAGGGREPLVAPGERLATSDPDTAQTLVTARLKDLDARRRTRALHGITRATTLAAFAREHLIAKAASGRFADQWLEALEVYLGRALDYFGDGRDLASIAVRDVREFAAHLGKVSNGRGGTMSAGNVRHHLNALSNLYRRAAAEGYVPPGYNPVAAWSEKPPVPQREAPSLQPQEAASLLEAARTYRAPDKHGAIRFGYEMLATFLLTGGREEEVLGLEVDDVSLERRTIRFRPNRWRRLKTRGSDRTVPLWRQLAEILGPYIFPADRPPRAGLLFPSYVTGEEAMLTDVRKYLDQVAIRAGFLTREVVNAKGKVELSGRFIRTKMFRHTYCSARLQTLDHGAPVAVYTVSRELGHTSTAMVERVYSHLGDVRHRADVVEYRPCGAEARGQSSGIPRPQPQETPHGH